MVDTAAQDLSSGYLDPFCHLLNYVLTSHLCMFCEVKIIFVQPGCGRTGYSDNSGPHPRQGSERCWFSERHVHTHDQSPSTNISSIGDLPEHGIVYAL
ncbi:hypothetical protein GDO81_009792 [Engystomops pustulosus]|uniref:Uncharacterized protein n=1 Tax=Engystomops pustulosus TaxID=76066 RepID=A0AAV7BU78_ENGPU|nr:hypothetical protein GDO81_009792 [Engystomops pustulosus]